LIGRLSKEARHGPDNPPEERLYGSNWMNKGFGVTVTVRQPGEREPKTAPLVVVARDERDAELIPAHAAGPNASAETLRELTDEEVLAYELDLLAHGTAKVLPILNL
jgi:hypothetical protein